MFKKNILVEKSCSNIIILISFVIIILALKVFDKNFCYQPLTIACIQTQSKKLLTFAFLLL